MDGGAVSGKAKEVETWGKLISRIRERTRCNEVAIWKMNFTLLGWRIRIAIFCRKWSRVIFNNSYWILSLSLSLLAISSPISKIIRLLFLWFKMFIEIILFNYKNCFFWIILFHSKSSRNILFFLDLKNL